MIKRIIMYIALILAAFMLQNNFFAGIKWIDCTPNLLLIVTFCFGFLRGRVHGMLIGFFSGLLADVFFGTSLGYYALIYLVLGYANGILGDMFYSDSLSMPVVLCIANVFIYSLYVFVTKFLLNGATNFGYYLIHVIMPEMVYTALITLAVYKPLKKLDAWMESLQKRSAKKFV